MAIFQHGNKMRIDVTIKGVRYVRGFVTREEAAAWHARAKQRVALGLPVDEALEATTDLTVADALRIAISSWTQQRDGQGSISNGQDVSQFLGMNTRLSSLRQADQQRLVAHLQGRGLSNGTINRKLSALSRLLNVAAEAGGTNRLKIKYLKESEGRTRFLSFLEEQYVLADLRRNDEADYRDYVITALDTGGRLSELLAMQPSWIHKEATGAWTLTFPGKLTKSGKTRSIPLTTRVVAILLGRMEGEGSIWPTDWNVDKVDDKWAAMRSRIGLAGDPEFVFHACRHTFGTRLYEATGDLLLVRDWLGHADIRTTTIYAKTSARSLRRGIEALEAMTKTDAA